jgi:hypothetical protein
LKCAIFYGKQVCHISPQRVMQVSLHSHHIDK